jgi:hypothetical protein
VPIWKNKKRNLNVQMRAGIFSGAARRHLLLMKVLNAVFADAFSNSAVCPPAISKNWLCLQVVQFCTSCLKTGQEYN